jgi:hypothetical protein
VLVDLTFSLGVCWDSLDSVWWSGGWVLSPSVSRSLSLTGLSWILLGHDWSLSPSLLGCVGQF